MGFDASRKCTVWPKVKLNFIGPCGNDLRLADAKSEPHQTSFHRWKNKLNHSDHSITSTFSMGNKVIEWPAGRLFSEQKVWTSNDDELSHAITMPYNCNRSCVYSSRFDTIENVQVHQELWLSNRTDQTADQEKSTTGLKILTQSGRFYHLVESPTELWSTLNLLHKR